MKSPVLARLLGFCALLALAVDASGQTIVNPSFETDASTGAGTGPITGWPFTAGSGGINDSAGPFADNGVIPDGSKVAFIHLAGTMHQVVSGFTPGLQYRLRYYENARLGAGTANVRVTVGGVTMVATHAVVAVGGSSPYVQKTTEPFTATAATLDVAFVVSGSGDFTVLLDKVEMNKNLDVTNLGDTGPGSLRQTILDAPAGSTITFAPGVTGTVGVYEKITIDKSLTIVGPGSSKLILRNARGEGVDTGSGVDNRIFYLTANVPVTISGLTVVGGRTNELHGLYRGGGAGIRNEGGPLTLTDVTISDCIAKVVVAGSDAFGGGVTGVGRFATLTLNNCTIANNQARTGGGVYGESSCTIRNSLIADNVAQDNGAGLALIASLAIINNSTIDNSTISGNSVQAGGSSNFQAGGGGMAIDRCTVTLTNTTVSSNVAHTTATQQTGALPATGGGVYFFGINDSHLILRNSTVTNNLTTRDTYPSTGEGAGIYMTAFTASDVTMRNSLLAGNRKVSANGAETTSDIYLQFGSGAGSPINSEGFNLIGSIGNSLITGTTTGNIVGTNAAPVDARLAPLGFYGGVTPTHALLTTSPAINAGNTANSPATDQRGAARVGIADIGAFELNNTANGGTYVTILPQGVLTVPYSYTLVPHLGSSAASFTYSVTSGALPGGISLSTQLIYGGTSIPQPVVDGVVSLSGTPTVAGTFSFGITASNGTLTSATNYRLIVPTNSTVTAINPTSGDTLGSDNVTITGTGFTGATGVTLGGTPVLSFTVVSNTSITAVTPAHVQGLASVLVSKGDSANAANTLYTYVPVLFTQGQYDASRTAGQNDVTSAPNSFNLYTTAQYSANYTSGQNNVVNSPNSFGLYTLSQVQSLNVGVPLITKDQATGKFKLTVGVKKSTNLATVPYSAFPMNGAGTTTVINAQGNFEFVFPATDNAAFFRLESQ